MSGDKLLSTVVSLAGTLIVTLLLLKLGAPSLGQALANSIDPARDQADKAGVYDRTFDPVLNISLDTMKIAELVFTIVTILGLLIRLIRIAGKSSH
ncbi:MAG: hypothetical protein F7C35_02570 [Desulfurococcales archaeon]|nr:hypothetical protein [Desulfurococcales archaeon]